MSPSLPVFPTATSGNQLQCSLWRFNPSFICSNHCKRGVWTSARLVVHAKLLLIRPHFLALETVSSLSACTVGWHFIKPQHPFRFSPHSADRHFFELQFGIFSWDLLREVNLWFILRNFFSRCLPLVSSHGTSLVRYFLVIIVAMPRNCLADTMVLSSHGVFIVW